MINLQAVLFHVFDEGDMKAINITLMLYLLIGQSFINLLSENLDNLLSSLYY